MSKAPPLQMRRSRRIFGAIASAGMLIGSTAWADGVLSLYGPLPDRIASRVGSERVITGASSVPHDGRPLIYAATLGDDPAALVAGLPAGALLVVGDCAAAASLADIGAPAAQVAVPQDGASCDAEALAEAFGQAAKLPADQRTDALQSGGYRLIGRAAPVAVAPAGVVGGLVISAMPVEAASPAIMQEEIIVASLSTTTTTTMPIQPTTPAAAPNAPFVPIGETPSRPGLPVPSIIIGDLAVLMTSGQRGPLGMPHEVRQAIRQRDPAMFDRLVSQGAFDPAEDQIAAAVQTELARMNCYAGGIDGNWGGGSSSALTRFVQAGGSASASGGTPDIALYRTMIRSDGVSCPDAPVAAAPAAVRSSGGGGGGTRNTRARPAAQQPASSGRRTPAATGRQQQAAPAERSPRRINPGLTTSGVIR